MHTHAVLSNAHVFAQVQNHEGWIGSGKVSTLIALLSAMGKDCTEDVLMSHDSQYVPRSKNLT